MKKLTLIALTILIPQLAVAAGLPGFAQLKNKIEQRAMSRLPNATKRAAGCTDFGGAWKGKCTIGSEETTEHVVNVYQSECEWIAIDGELLALGSLSSESRASTLKEGAFASNGISVLDWNDARTELIFTSKGYLKPLNKPGKMELDGKGRVYLVDNKLHSDGAYGDYEMKCVYEKP